MSVTNYLHQQHIDCDDLFVVMEEAMHNQQWDTADKCLRNFISATESHFRIEETLLFPAFEAATGSVMGPTQMMRHEHAQMRGLFDQLTEALTGRDGKTASGAAETLLILMQQHNLKEENILYPMCDRALTAEQIQQVVEQETEAEVLA